MSIYFCLYFWTARVSHRQAFISAVIPANTKSRVKYVTENTTNVTAVIRLVYKCGLFRLFIDGNNAKE